MKHGWRSRAGKTRYTRTFLASGLLSLMIITVAGLAGCASDSVFSRRQYNTREKAFSLIDEGHKLEAEGAVLLAIKRYNRAATLYDCPQAYFEMGRIYESLNKPDEASTAYQQALLMTPDYKEARFALLSLGFKPVGSDPNDQDIANAQAWAQERALPRKAAASGEETPLSAGETAQNGEDLLSEAQRMPTPEEVRSVLFIARGEDSELPSALDPDFPSDRDIILGSYPYHLRKAEQLRRRGQFAEAADEFQNAMQADPTQVKARLALGDMMMKLERYPQARFHFERAIEDFPQKPQPYLKLGNYYLAIKQAETTRELYHKALERDPLYTEAINNLAVLSMQEKDYPTASALLDKLIEVDPTYDNAYLNRGIIASDMDKDNEAALKYFKEYVNLGGARSAQVRQWIQELEASSP